MAPVDLQSDVRALLQNGRALLLHYGAMLPVREAAWKEAPSPMAPVTLDVLADQLVVVDASAHAVLNPATPLKSGKVSVHVPPPPLYVRDVVIVHEFADALD